MRTCAIVAVLAVACVLAVNQAEAGCSDEWHQSVMSRMDEWRASEGVGSLGCDDDLAAGAQDYANGCPDGHAGGYIENMAWNSDPISGVDAWGGEVSSRNIVQGCGKGCSDTCLSESGRQQTAVCTQLEGARNRRCNSLPTTLFDLWFDLNSMTSQAFALIVPRL